MSTSANDKSQGLTFGDFVAAACRAWGRRRANGMVRLAVSARVLVFRGGPRVVITED